MESVALRRCRRFPDSNSSGCYLSEELLEQILSRLEVRWLLRFRAVCKSWRSLIDSPTFINAHLHRNSTQLFLVHSTVRAHYGGDECVDDVNLFSLHCPNTRNLITNFDYTVFAPPLSKLVLGGACDGILCVAVILPNNNHHNYLWNPATKRFKRLPQHTLPDPDRNSMSVVISLGFGFDPIANDYKVVRIMSFHDGEGRIRVEVYSVNGGFWREIKSEERYMAIGVSSCVTCVNGVIYWDACGCVLAFDLNREVLTRISFPLPCMEFDDSYILQCKACVALLGYFYCDEDATLWCIDYDNQGGYSWNKKWSRKLEITKFLWLQWLLEAFAYLDTGDIIAENRQKLLVVHDPNTREDKPVPIPSQWRTDKVLINYTESLLHIN